MELEFMPCPCCRSVTLAEVPPCVDEHGGDCPERVCTLCGTALTVGGRAVWDVASRVIPTAPANTRQDRSAA